MSKKLIAVLAANNLVLGGAIAYLYNIVYIHEAKLEILKTEIELLRVGWDYFDILFRAINSDFQRLGDLVNQIIYFLNSQ